MTGVSVRAVVEQRGVDVAFDVGAGEVLAVLGPNGAGKSTILHVIAGLVRPDDGLVRVGPRVLSDTQAGVHVATHDRRVGLLMQDPLLFPHLDVAANVAFAPGSRRPEHWLAQVDATGLADRRPRQLSGGQAQRVALARALAAEPDLLLLDEPLAGLDVAAAAAMRKVLRDVLTRDGRSAVMVTHDVLDVVTLADRVLVLESGRIAEIGSAATVLAAPRSDFGARLAGVNLVRGTADGRGVLTTLWGAAWHASPAPGIATAGPAVALFHPAAVAVYRDRPHGSPRNTVEVTVAELDGRGPAIRVRAEEQPDGSPGLAADITADSATELRLAPGERVFFAVKAQEVTLHPAQ
ncbi:molybdenum ABC transporter ATP-binding protein [Mycolicibacterium novocastrense]|uniref:sulfate/molybdate ABC transporter ATP-binding protein n=1 Tax=Mycolicibacterium novocastrense TaxID=59813 RepID=UPI0007464F62|nr:ATP-binding cassette domain-containing protein [Mycolicibacterium novocastrense]KUH68743.1 molybdenum ABC transporter ATP-binding protein [Mycolicibacterium novocastrense]KUH68782.1 molybdenum ABC transporter ATP-binding protein [Mycolicibacterium novocastrense]KUH77232.1 molybdenum ABC transporter ATP-binding protein [Mycolicibacterium novocastrense]